MSLQNLLSQNSLEVFFKALRSNAIVYGNLTLDGVNTVNSQIIATDGSRITLSNTATVENFGRVITRTLGNHGLLFEKDTDENILSNLRFFSSNTSIPNNPFVQAGQQVQIPFRFQTNNAGVYDGQTPVTAKFVRLGGTVYASFINSNLIPSLNHNVISIPRIPIIDKVHIATPVYLDLSAAGDLFIPTVTIDEGNPQDATGNVGIFYMQGGIVEVGGVILNYYCQLFPKLPNHDAPSFFQTGTISIWPIASDPAVPGTFLQPQQTGIPVNQHFFLCPQTISYNVDIW